MAEPYVGEIRQFAGTFAPVGWQMCNGALLNINDYEILFTLVGTTYGGDGQNTFGIPNLQGRVPVHQGNGLPMGQQGGAEQVTLNTSQLPVHSHTPMAATVGGSDNPSGNVWGPSSGAQPYGTAPGTAPMNGVSVTITGNNLPHENRIPYQAITYIIATEGIWPSQQ